MAGSARILGRVGHLGNAAKSGDCLRTFAIDVGDGKNFGFRHAERKRFSVHAANAAGAYDSEMKFVSSLCPRTKNLRLNGVERFL